MENLLIQALQLTVIGMGMTFGAIGALVGGMYLMTALVRDRAPMEANGSNPEEDDSKLSLLGITVDLEELNGTPLENQESRIEAPHSTSSSLKSTKAGSEYADPSGPLVAAAAAVSVALAQELQVPALSSCAPSVTGGWNTCIRGRQLLGRQYYDLQRLRRMSSGH
ncbi:MAG: OadG family protein [Anaerolineae bacterium]|nr:OadG family protein [Anaerolineae bacterium]